MPIDWGLVLVRFTILIVVIAGLTGLIFFLCSMLAIPWYIPALSIVVISQIFIVFYKMHIEGEQTNDQLNYLVEEIREVNKSLNNMLKRHELV